MKITASNTFKTEFSLTLDEVVLIVLTYLEKNPKVVMENMSAQDMRYLARDFVISNGLSAVNSLNPKLLIKKQDLLVACKGRFA